MEVKRLCKSETDKVIAGVCGGIAEYFEIDSLIIRLLFVLLALAVGSGLLLYLIFALLIPSREKAEHEAEAQRAYYEQQGSPYANESAPVRSYSAEAPAQPEAAAGSVHESYQDKAAYAGPDEAPAAKAQPVKEQPAPGPRTVSYGQQESAKTETKFNTPKTESAPQGRSANAVRDSRTIGMLLVAIGGIILLKYFIPRISITVVAAVILILVGLYFVFRKK